MLHWLGPILGGVILPVLLLAGLGWLVQRFYPLHMPTLTRLNIYLFVPAFLFVKVFESTLSWSQIGGIAWGVMLPMFLLGLPLYALLRQRRAPGPTIAAMVIGGVVYNAGNFGIPVAELLYQGQGVLFPGMETAADGPAVQALVVMLSNLTVFGIGYMLLALAKGDGLKGAFGYFRLPMLYVVGLGFLLRDWQVQLPRWIDYPVHQLAAGLVPVALITLGAQLGQRARWPNWRLIGPVLGVKLLALPAVTAAVVLASNLLPWPKAHLWPWPGAQLIIAAAAPTAVNTLLLTLELDGDAEVAADCVFWTTILSGLSVTLVLATVIATAR